MAKEIERKFLMNKVPNGLEKVLSIITYRGYLCTSDTEVRLTEFRDENNDILKCPVTSFDHPILSPWQLTVKTGKGIVREEVEWPISEQDYLELAKKIPNPFIRKDYTKYKMPNGLYLEFSIVDKGTGTEFSYGEIEFSSIEEANKFIIPWENTIDVSEDEFYKMKNYWKRTRERM